MTAIAANTQTEREELLRLLLDRGILRRGETQPVLSRDGSSARWMLDSLAVTLQPRGGELAGKLVLDRLRRFDGRQLATFGLTGVPILQSAVLQSGGHYRGLLVRNERKAHGSRKLIEGQIDFEEPVILIEDSIASGGSALAGLAILEEAGLRVEGIIALVRFGWEGGCSEFARRGYHVEAIYDIFADFMSQMDGEEGPEYNPTKSFREFQFSSRRAAEGLHPAHLAREVVREYLASGEVLAPPRSLDRPGYDSAGGAWVSIRPKEDQYERHARDGFWHFPGERSWGVAEDVVRAALRTAYEFSGCDEPLQLLTESDIAVTLFSRLEATAVGELDNNRYGIVVVSGDRPEIMGGALPAMPGIADEWQQFRHAHTKNATLYPYESYVVYRHEVSKYVEPGANWQPSGVPKQEHEVDLGSLAAKARNIILKKEQAAETPSIGLPGTTGNQLFVTIYLDGEVCGCMGSEIEDLDTDLKKLTAAALHDERFEHALIDADTSVAVSVSLLTNRLEMGNFSREEVRVKYRHGQQALMVEQNNRAGMLLPFITTWLRLDAEDFVDEVLDKAGVTRPPYNWIRFDCVTWLADEEGEWRLEGGFKRIAPSLSAREIASLHVDYLMRNQLADGSSYFSYFPFQNALERGIDMARLGHNAWVMARAGNRDHAAASLRYIVAQEADDDNALARDAFVLLALSEPGMAEVRDRGELCERLWASIDRHGRIVTDAAVVVETEEEVDEEDVAAHALFAEELQNYVPGQVLLGLAAAVRTGVTALNQSKIERAFRYYRHLFRYKRDFGQVSWMALAAAAWWRLTQERELADVLFEITDWILTFQQNGNQPTRGAFLTGHQPGTPGFTTAVYLEAVAAALHVAEDVAETNRLRRYDEAWRLGFAFQDRLIIQERDAPLLPNADYAYGGLRENLYDSHVRIDFVQHSLAAIIERYPEVLVRNKP